MSKVTHFALTSNVQLHRTCELVMSLTIHPPPSHPDLTGGHHIPGALHRATASCKLNKRHLVAITTNNGSNVIRAVELNGWLRMRRFTHKLHFAIDEAVLEQVLRYSASSKNNKKCQHLRSVISAFMKCFTVLQLRICSCVLLQYLVKLKVKQRTIKMYSAKTSHYC